MQASSYSVNSRFSSTRWPFCVDNRTNVRPQAKQSMSVRRRCFSLQLHFRCVFLVSSFNFVPIKIQDGLLFRSVNSKNLHFLPTMESLKSETFTNNHDDTNGYRFDNKSSLIYVWQSTYATKCPIKNRRTTCASSSSVTSPSTHTPCGRNRHLCLTTPHWEWTTILILIRLE